VGSPALREAMNKSLRGRLVRNSRGERFEHFVAQL
jgi:hypothetical protein